MNDGWMEENVVVIDGEIVSPSAARVSVFDRGFLYGDSVYEVMRVYGGTVFALSEHTERLYRSAERVLIPMPISKSEFEAEISEVVVVSRIPNALLRVHVTRGIGMSLEGELDAKPLRVIVVTPVRPPSQDLYMNGVEISLVSTQRTGDHSGAVGAKVANYLVSLLALRAAKDKGAHEAVFTNTDGAILEGATSNVFIVRSGRVLTPALDLGILAGITRDFVLKAARHLDLPVEESVIQVDDLKRSDEAFLTSTSREVLGVVGVDGVPVADGRVGPITKKLHEAFRFLGQIPS